MTGEGPASAVIVRTSPIHGAGLFAARDIASGESLCEYRGSRITKDESRRRSEAAAPGEPVYRVAFDDDTDVDGDIADNPAKFANHGCEPNAELVRKGDRLWLVASREITAGSEILFDYGFGLAESLAHPCRCGTPGCVGRILAEPLRPLLKKHLRRTRAR
jgi:SET domain-containing protein